MITSVKFFIGSIIELCGANAATPKLVLVPLAISIFSKAARLYPTLNCYIFIDSIYLIFNILVNYLAILAR